MADKDIIDFNKSQFDIMVDMLVLSGMSKDDAIVKVTKDFEDEGMVLKNRGGMMNINRMTAPLGYYRGGSPVAPESSEGFEPILGNWMKEARMRQAQPPAGAVDMTGQYRPQPERPPWDNWLGNFLTLSHGGLSCGATYCPVISTAPAGG